MTIEKQAIPVLLDTKTGEPTAVIFFNQSRERIIYMLHKADEDELVSLFVTESKLNTSTG